MPTAACKQVGFFIFWPGSPPRRRAAGDQEEIGQPNPTHSPSYSIWFMNAGLNLFGFKAMA
jgi:hypothetical protein